MTNDQIVAQIKLLAVQYQLSEEQKTVIDEEYEDTLSSGAEIDLGGKYTEAIHWMCALAQYRLHRDLKPADDYSPYDENDIGQ